MRAREPRRYLLAVEVGTYDAAAWPPLIKTKDELQKVVDLLTSDSFRYERILESESKLPLREALLTVLSAWCRSGERQADDHLIVYWTGHGEVLNERLYLVLPKTQELVAGSLSLDDLVGVLLGAESRTGPVLLLLDMCFAGQGINDAAQCLDRLTRQRSTANTPELGLIGAAAARETARQLVFSDAFVEAITSSVDPNKRLPPALAISEIQRKMTDKLGRKKIFPFLLSGHSDWLFFRNPYRIAHWPRDVDTATESLLARLDGVARGVVTAASDGWFFKGRKQVFADLCRWLRSAAPAGLCRITGGIGAGKSAILARLYTLSRADYRRHVPQDVLNETELPPVGAIEGMILLHKKSLGDVFNEIVAMLHLQVSTTEQLTIELKKHQRWPVLVFDGLDEADRPNSTLTLLETLAGGAVKVIVGVRSPCPPSAFPEALTIDLDAAPWSDPGAVESHVVERLRNELVNDTSAGGMWLHDRGATGRDVVKRAHGNFLLASLIVTAMISRRAYDQGGPDWKFPETVGEAFDQIFGRLRDEEVELATRDVLVPLAYAEGNGMPKGELWRALACRLSGRDYRMSSVDNVFKKVPWFLDENLSDGGSVFRLFHIALAEHLQKGRCAEDVHGQLAATLQVCLEQTDPQALTGSGDAAYAWRYLATHLRRAGSWQELGRLLMTPAWIAGKSSRYLPFESADLTSDMEQSRQAARDANARAAQHEHALPALAETLWWMVWRSAQVTLIEQTPAAAWPLLIQAREMSPDHALRLLASIGDETRLASRLAALARVLTGADLDRLLDLADGIEPPPVDPAASLQPDPSRDKPLELYETILQNALSGRDGKRLAQRALDTAARVPDYQRWLVLAAAMPHFDTSQLDAAHGLIAAMTHDRLYLWDALALASYTAECARRGDERAVRRTKELPRDTPAWWFSAAALFALEKEAGRVVLANPSLTDEIVRATESIDDGYLCLHVMSALIQALPAVHLPGQRAALAVFLRRLRGCTYFGSAIEQAALAGKHLPFPHGARLLSWARARFFLARKIETQFNNFNWFHTPPVLAQAFASKGDIANALDVVGYTAAHEFYRPMAFDDVARAFQSAPHKMERAPVDLEGLLDSARSSDMRSQLLCAHAATLGAAERPDIARLLGTLHLALERDVRLVRCAVVAQRARHCSANDIDELLRHFLSLDPPAWIRQPFAVNCAAGDHVQAALEMLATIDRFDKAWAAAATLSAAADTCRLSLLRELNNDANLVQEMLTFTPDVLIDIGVHAHAELLHALSDMAMGIRYTSLQSHADDLKDMLAVRAFELNERALAQGLLDQRQGSLFLLHAARRLHFGARRAFIALMNATCLPPSSQSATLHALLVRHLGLSESDMEAASLDVVDAIIADPDSGHFLWQGQRLLDLFDGIARDRLLSFAMQTKIDRITIKGDTNFSFEHDFGWMLPWMNANQLDMLVHLARRLHDDYRREEAIVLLLPQYAQRHGCKAALALRASIHRYNFQGRSWAAVWLYLPEAERSEAFAALLPERVWKDGSEAEALATLAPHLSETQLAKAVRWIIAHHRHNDPERLGPLVDAARRKPRLQAMAFWDAIVTEAARLPCADAMGWLAGALPLAERLGGSMACTAIDAMLSRAATQWPAQPVPVVS